MRRLTQRMRATADATEPAVRSELRSDAGARTLRSLRVHKHAPVSSCSLPVSGVPSLSLFSSSVCESVRSPCLRRRRALLAAALVLGPWRWRVGRLIAVPQRTRQLLDARQCVADQLTADQQREEESRAELGRSLTLGTHSHTMTAQTRKNVRQDGTVSTGSNDSPVASNAASSSLWSYLLCPFWLHLLIEGPTSLVMLARPQLVPVPQSSDESSFYVQGIGNLLFCLNAIVWRVRGDPPQSERRQLVGEALTLYHAIAVILVATKMATSTTDDGLSTMILSLVIHVTLAVMTKWTLQRRDE